MEFPILAKEVRLVLRNRLSFFFVFSLYLLQAYFLTSSMDSYGVAWRRETLGRELFGGFIVWCLFGLSLHAGILAAGALLAERENRTEEILRSAPLRGWSVVAQKGFTPFAVEWLFMLGALPFISVVFLLGGIPPSQFLKDFVSLGIWINTCILIGLAVSSRVDSLLKAIGWTLGLGVSLFFVGFLEELGPRGSTGSITYLAPITSLSPMHMVTPFRGQSPFSTVWQSWLSHSVLQIVLFFLAARGWARAKHPEGGMSNGKPDAGWISLSSARFSPREEGGVFSLGSSLYHEAEGRIVLRKGLRPLLIPLFVLFNFLALCIIGVAGLDFGGEDPEWVMVSNSFATTGCVVTVMAMSASAFHRERSRLTAAFLLTAPISLSEVFLGKWRFHFNLGFLLLVTGCVVPLGFLLTSHLVRWSIGEIVSFDALLYTMRALPFIPLIAFYGIVGGLFAKRNWMPFLAGSFFLAMVGFVFAIGIFERVTRPDTAWDRCLVFIFYSWGPPCLAILTGILLIASLPSVEAQTPALLAGLLLLILGLFDLRMGVEYDNFAHDYWFGQITYEEFRYEWRWYVPPLCLAYLGWRWIALRPHIWWVKRLTVTGEKHLAISN